MTTPGADEDFHHTHEQLILRNAGDAFIAIDENGVILEWNAESERIYGFSAERAIGSDVADLIIPESYRVAHHEGVAHFIAAGHGRIPGSYIELEALHASGRVFPIEMVFWGLQRGGRWNFYSFGRDISERRAREADLRYRSRHDELTGLANRSTALEHIDHALADWADGGGGVAVLFLDLDRFKLTQQSLGHESGNQLLRKVADRLQLAARAQDLVARVGDDEFVVVYSDLSDPADAVMLADRVSRAFTDPIELSDDTVRSGASISVAVAIDVNETGEDMLREASAGVILGRERGYGQITVLDAELRGRIRQRLQVERELADAVDRGELRLHYQPVLRTSDRTVVGVEALLRWQHPERGLLGPDAFIDVAEQSGLIVPIGDWVIGEAARQGAAWRSAGVGSLGIGVNLSARQFSQVDLVDTVAAAVTNEGLDWNPVGLHLEMTESLLMADPAAAVATLDALHDLGVGLSIDDFGTGYSSFAYLKAFPVDVLKIDRSFIVDIARDERDRAIVQAIINLGRALGITVLAEGIETDDQADILTELGCDLLQGFLFARPRPPDELTALLLERTRP